MIALGWLTNLIQRGRASLDRVDAIIQTQPEIRPENPSDNQLGPRAIPPVRIQGSLTLSNIRFHYPSGNQEQDPIHAINGIDLSVSPGETVGVVGPPGSGKTTLLNLIPRLYDVTSGVILIDGTDIRRMDPDYLRMHIASVPQEPFLFSGTIYENIVFDDKAADEQALAATLLAAALDQTIDMFDDGLDTLVGEKGVILSGGQKQRVALARALFCDVPILLLDDPISQVDIQTADTIIRALRRLNGRRTIVMVSHRLSALKYADRIIVLEKGRVAEAGTHEQLVSTGGYYARTAAIQTWEEGHYEH